MKITNFAILFVLLLLPIFVTTNMKINDQRQTMRTQDQYDSAIHAAVQDAAQAISFNEQQNYEAQYGSKKRVRVNKEAAINSFFKTLYFNFGIENDPVAQGVIQRYIPIILVIDYDGYEIYTADEYKDAQSSTNMKFIWKPKKPYAYADAEGNSLSFTLDDYVVAYDVASKKWHEGKRQDVSTQVSIPLLNDPTTFDQVRRTTIVNDIENDLEYTINQYNAEAKKYGISYTFTLPTISHEQWNNTINDVGVMAFIQGIPIGTEYYNNYAFGGGRIIKKTPIFGSIVNGIKYYYPSTCSLSYPVTEKFTNEKDAASKGYMPLSCSGSP